MGPTPFVPTERCHHLLPDQRHRERDGASLHTFHHRPSNCLHQPPPGLRLRVQSSRHHRGPGAIHYDLCHPSPCVVYVNNALIFLD